MEPEAIVNRTDAVTDLHLCSEIDHFNYKLTTTPSVICVTLYIFLALLGLVTVCGNLLVIISIIYFKQFHTPTNYLILSLAVADLLVGILVFPLSVAFSLSSCLYSEGLFCKLRSSFDVSLSACSIMNLCCISVDRYYAVCQPLTYHSKINHWVVVVMIVASWGISFLVAVGMMIPGLNNEKCKETCFIDVFVANMVGLAFSFYLPVIIMICIYLKIFLVAKRQAQSIHGRKKTGGAVSKMETKATKTLAIVLGVFLFCWTPFFIYITFLPFSNSAIPVPVTETLGWLALSNSMFNPFIYAFFYSWYKSAFKMIISGKILQGDYSNSKMN
ncbi:trace amine-associated receptor 1-like [Menidia menidia]